MSRKTYDSVTYFAQEFRNCLIDAKVMSKLSLGALRAKQSGKLGNIVSFELQGIESHVIFEYKDKKPYIFHEMSTRNGEGNKRSRVVERIMKIERSKTGRISGNYYPNLIKSVILPNIRRFYQEVFP